MPFDRRTEEPGLSTSRWFYGATYMRNHVEFLLVLRGVKPCVYFMKGSDSHEVPNAPVFSRIVLDALLPIMQRFDLWSYGFELGFKGNGGWVLADTQSASWSLVERIFFKQQKNFSTHDFGRALGYPCLSDVEKEGGQWVTFMNRTDGGLDEDGHCCGPAMQFLVVGHGEEADWQEVTKFFRKCKKVANSVGTEIFCHTEEHDELDAWLWGPRESDEA